jgi:glycosyltransferase involved in cell wall biosynthesis
LDIARDFDVNIYYHPWKNWADQRNWALDNCQLKYEWVLFLDADEQMTPQSQKEIALKTKNAQKECCGFYLGFDYYFLNKRIRKAMYPHIRLVKKRVVRWRVDGAREVCSAPDDSPLIEAKLIHNDHRGLKHWFTKQAHNAELEAIALYQKRHCFSNNVRCKNQTNNPQTAKSKLHHRLRKVIDTSCPPFIRTLLFFPHHLVFKTDIRDGWAGLVYAFLYGLCYPIMIDIKYMQLRVGGRLKRNSKK